MGDRKGERGGGETRDTDSRLQDTAFPSHEAHLLNLDLHGHGGWSRWEIWGEMGDGSKTYARGARGG